MPLMEKNWAADSINIKSESSFIVIDQEGNLVSEHTTSQEACTGLARFFRSTRQEGTIYKKENGEWIIY
jgi:hypothetical protein